VARRLWWAQLLLVAALAYPNPTYSVRPAMVTDLGDHPWRLVLPALALGALLAQLAF
jgi:hypothetical protein